ncbi:LLM class flavin-dependent oxidoreductase [Mycolicibacterium vinylchloridicum]|uniref:LLM class flavin-dependent oxidoreductase n=1 Tax=Mycolicibacterium vinylchloridicum TaxID=2736928 RepID=UPI0015C79BF1|nr:LLM class flavin-dependent oxidoreductase [Mycolicibacterium vinylchloridicum]
MFTLRFDMRAPSIGAPASELYAAAMEMAEWSDSHGCLSVYVCEHHCAEDGYLPSPLVLSAALAARTHAVPIIITVILPFYDPARLAEDMAVLDHVSKGRATYVFGIGYRAEEFAHFGLELAARGRLCDEKIEVLRRLLAGETVEWAGRRMTVTPQPYRDGGPTMMWGGASLAAARRAGRYGLGMLANGVLPGMRDAYEEACRTAGHQPGFFSGPDRQTATVCFVANDVDEAWAEIGKYLLHDAMAYAEWNPDNEASANISTATTVEELRTSPSHVILTREQAAERIRNGEILNLTPLCGGLPPEIAWPYLRRAVAACSSAATA